MKSINWYQRDIIAATGCMPEDAEEIEDYMRNVIFHSTLDWQDQETFDNAARTAYSDILFLRGPEGQKLIEQMKKESQ